MSSDPTIPADVAADIVAALSALSSVPKSSTANAGKMRYSYFDLADLMEHVRPILAQHGLAVMQHTSAEPGSVTVRTVLVHRTGHTITADPLRLPAGNGPQDAGSAITYARRYGLSALLGIAGDDDDGAQAQRGAQHRHAPAPAEPTGDEREAQALYADLRAATPEVQAAVKRLATDRGKGLSVSALAADTGWRVELRDLIDTMTSDGPADDN